MVFAASLIGVNGLVPIDTVQVDTVQVDFLVIAGGGSGAPQKGGGGGAGGYRTSYGTSGGNSPAEPPLILQLGTTYSIQVGGGGAGLPAYPLANGNPGKESFIKQGSTTLINCVGGGGGADEDTRVGGAGGSGGGAIGTAQPGQGFGGGDFIESMSYSPEQNKSGVPYARCGGGGAGGPGSSTSPDGGIGLVNNITGQNVYRGGGGAGGATDGEGLYHPEAGTATAGGGQGINAANDQGQASGRNGRGGGGGGGTIFSYNEEPSGSGGSGLIVLRYPETRTITITGSIPHSTTSVGSDKVTEFGRKFNYGNIISDTATIFFS